jgi:hypothetical protein
MSRIVDHNTPSPAIVFLVQFIGERWMETATAVLCELKMILRA